MTILKQQLIVADMEMMIAEWKAGVVHAKRDLLHDEHRMQERRDYILATQKNIANKELELAQAMQSLEDERAKTPVT